MKILIIGPHGISEIYQRDFVPRVGDKIDIFYDPLPTVTSVVFWPSKARQRALGLEYQNIEAIVTVA